MLAGSESEVPVVFKGDPSLTAGDAVLERGSGTRVASDGDAALSRARGNERLLPGGVEFVGELVCEDTVCVSEGVRVGRLLTRRRATF